MHSSSLLTHSFIHIFIYFFLLPLLAITTPAFIFLYAESMEINMWYKESIGKIFKGPRPFLLLLCSMKILVWIWCFAVRYTMRKMYLIHGLPRREFHVPRFLFIFLNKFVVLNNFRFSKLTMKIAPKEEIMSNLTAKGSYCLLLSIWRKSTLEVPNQILWLLKFIISVTFPVST